MELCKSLCQLRIEGKNIISVEEDERKILKRVEIEQVPAIKSKQGKRTVYFELLGIPLNEITNEEKAQI